MSKELQTPYVTDWRLADSESVQQHGSDVARAGMAAPAPQPRPAFVEQFAAIIRTTPCATNVTGDYADARYYLDRAIATNSASSGTLSVQTDSFPGLKKCLTATNLAELASNSHLLAPGTIVQVFALYTRPGIKVYVFNQPPPDGAVVKVTGAAEGGGKYTGRILSGASDAVASGDVAMPEGLTIPPADNALIVNEEEDGLDGHRLQIPCYAIGQIAGNSDGLSIVMIRGALGATSEPTMLGDGTGGAVDPDDADWSKATDGTPLDVWVQTRSVWDSGTGTLFGYLRKFSFDARGGLYAVSAENQITVDVAQACS
jgi:hypothetical protein